LPDVPNVPLVVDRVALPAEEPILSPVVEKEIEAPKVVDNKSQDAKQPNDGDKNVVESSKEAAVEEDSKKPSEPNSEIKSDSVPAEINEPELSVPKPSGLKIAKVYVEDDGGPSNDNEGIDPVSSSDSQNEKSEVQVEASKVIEEVKQPVAESDQKQKEDEKSPEKPIKDSKQPEAPKSDQKDEKSENKDEAIPVPKSSEPASKENEASPADGAKRAENLASPDPPISDIDKVELASPDAPIDVKAKLVSSDDISKEADSSKPGDESAPKEVNVEDVKENKSESEYEDVEDPDFDVFNSDDTNEKARLITVKYRQGAVGVIKKHSLSKKITIFVKTFYGERLKEKFEIDIHAEVGSLVSKMANKDEVNSYHIIKFMYPMGRMRSLSLTESFSDQSIPNNACLVLIGKKDFCWDFNRKGRNITVSTP
jgi:hypothetical protein